MELQLSKAAGIGSGIGIEGFQMTGIGNGIGIAQSELDPTLLFVTQREMSLKVPRPFSENGPVRMTILWESL